MPYHIQILSVGGDFDLQIREAAQALSGVQTEFQFSLLPERLRSYGKTFAKSEYHAATVFGLLGDYRNQVKGKNPYLIAVVDKQLRSNKRGNLFGSHETDESKGDAVITLHDHHLFTESTQLYLCYYLIRYALSFVCPILRNHDDSRGCFFDRKSYKLDLTKSMDSGNFCEECRVVLWQSFNEEIVTGIKKMVGVMKALRANSEEDLEAGSLKGEVEIGIITMREDEFEAMLDRFASRRRVTGKGSDYNYSRVKTRADKELRVVVARTPEQGPGAAQAIASSMITDLSPRWIFLVGIAGALPAPEYTLGDVLLSQRMHDFAVSAAIEGKKPEFQDMGGPMTLEVEKLVTNLRAEKSKLGQWSSKQFLGREKPQITAPKTIRSKNLYGNDDWKESVLKSLRKNFPEDSVPRDPDFRAAVIIAGSTLVKDTKLASLWQQTARHASAVEMELGGVCRAARYGADGATHVLAIRGLSDIVGYKRSPEWTEFACHSAAAFAHALIISGLITSKR